MQQVDARVHLRPLLTVIRQGLGTLFVLLAGCAGGDPEATGVVREAIIDGTSDDGDPAVVALVLTKEIYCSGTLVAPNVVLTAAHCVHIAAPDSVLFGTKRLDGSGRAIGVKRVSVHPRFSEDTYRNDIGLIELEEDGPASPLPMAAAPVAELAVGADIRLVGFGVPRPGATEELEKRSGATKISDVTPLDFRFHAMPARTCLGDSGGPSFLTVNGSEVVAGVTSSGDLNCEVYARHIRVDSYRSFIDPFIVDAANDRFRAKGSGCQTSSSRASPSWPLVALVGRWLSRKKRGNVQRVSRSCG